MERFNTGLLYKAAGIIALLPLNLYNFPPFYYRFLKVWIVEPEIVLFQF